MYKTFVALLFSMFIICNSANAKKFNIKRKYKPRLFEVGLSLGGSSFITSFNPDNKANDRFVNYWHNKINPGVGFSFTRNISPVFGISLNVNHSSLSGTWNDKWSPQPVAINGTDPPTYNSTINQYELLLDVNINKLVTPYTASDKWNVFLRTGPGVTKIKDNIAFYADQVNKNFDRFSFAFEPGVSFRLSDRIKFKAGTSMRIVFTDNLDGVHLFSSDPGWKYNYHISEIFQYTYLSVNYCLARKISAKQKFLSANWHRICNRNKKKYF